jgi:hypothetical protein
MWFCFKAIFLYDAHTCNGFEQWGEHELWLWNQLWVWLSLETIIPWFFYNNNQSNYVKSQVSHCAKNQASKKVCNNPTYSWMCNYCLQITHTGLVLHDCAIFVYSFQNIYNWVHPNWRILVRVIIGHSMHWFPTIRIMEFVPSLANDRWKKNKNEICIHNVLFKVTLNIRYIHEMLHKIMTKEMGWYIETCIKKYITYNWPWGKALSI